MVGETTSAPQSATLPNGVTLQYVEQGDPEGVPVLLLHGYVDSLQSYSEVLPHLPASIHAFAPTQRGHGDSSHPETGYQMEDFAADVVAFMDALGMRSAVLVGHSMGSFVALRAAISYPERVLGLVLIGSGGTPLRNNPVVVDLWETGVSRVEDPVDPEFVHGFQASMFTQPAPPAFLNTLVSESLKVPARVWRDALQGVLAVDLVDELAKITAPTLLVWGDQDGLMSRADQDALVDGIGESQLIVYPRIGHGTQWEEPARFAADLAAFVESIPAETVR